jgi:hypothetical protein
MEISGASTIFKYIMFSSILNIYQFGFYFFFLQLNLQNTVSPF